jgi:hypothetical protein
VTTAGKALTIRAMAESVLGAVQDHYAATDPAVTLPDRQYIAPGAPDQIAWDCEQLVVSVVGLGWGQAPSAAQSPQPRMGTHVSVTALRHVIFDVSLVRCAPSDGDPDTGIPAMADIHAAGLAYMTDIGLLSQALVVACATVRSGLDRSALVEPGAVNPAGPAGGFHGMSAQIAVTAGNLV